MSALLNTTAWTFAIWECMHALMMSKEEMKKILLTDI